MNSPTETALFIETDQSQVSAHRADQPMESSSTIKIPILYLALAKAARSGHGPDHTLARRPHHASRGSGILNWTAADRFSLAELLMTTMIYSDCLATNMLLDYIGGQASLNAWLADNGFISRLQMPYLYFSDDETVMPSVGTTTAREIARLFKRLTASAWPAALAQLVNRGTSRVHESWLEGGLAAPLPQLHHKTGSMIGSGGQTVLNAAGRFRFNGRIHYFGLLSRGPTGPAGAAAEAQMRRFVAGQLTAALGI